MPESNIVLMGENLTLKRLKRELLERGNRIKAIKVIVSRKSGGIPEETRLSVLEKDIYEIGEAEPFSLDKGMDNEVVSIEIFS